MDESNIVSSHVAEQSVQQLLAWAAAQKLTGFSAAPERTTAEILEALQLSPKAWERFRRVERELLAATGEQLSELPAQQLLDQLGIDCRCVYRKGGKSWLVAVDVTTNPKAVAKKEHAAATYKAPTFKALGYDRVLVVEYHLDLSFAQLTDEYRQQLLQRLQKALDDVAHVAGYVVSNVYLTLP